MVEVQMLGDKVTLVFNQQEMKEYKHYLNGLKKSGHIYFDGSVPILIKIYEELEEYFLEVAEAEANVHDPINP